MPLSPEYFVLFNEKIQSIRLELSDASAGSDDGLIPINALLSDLEICAEEDVLLQDALALITIRIDPLLDEARPFDEETLGAIHAFVDWAEGAKERWLKGNEPSPFELGADSSTTSASETAAACAAAAVAESAEEDELLEVQVDQDRALLDEFLTESTEHLEHIEEGLLELGRDATSEEAIAGLFRAFHSLKGLAGFLGLGPMQRLAHESESLLDLVRGGQRPANSGVIDAVLQAHDALAKFIQQVRETLQSGQQPTEVVPISTLLGTLRHLIENREAGEANSAEPARQRADTRGGETSAKSARNAPTTVRVPTVRLDSLLDTVGEMIIAHSQLSSRLGELGLADECLDDRFNRLTMLTRDLQRTALSLRMVPIKPVFRRVERLVHDLSARLHKPVEIELKGEDTELDRNAVEELADPLIHLVRNALDHGIEESPRDRVEAGKAAEGSIRLSARHEGGGIVIELSDDGRGVNYEKIRQRAAERDLLPADRPADEAFLRSVLFAPGFSTAANVSDLSGRGVGLDVVRRNIESLRGSVELDSIPGMGSTFRVRLPLTTAIIEGLLVRAGGERYVLPVHSVRESIRLEEKDTSAAGGGRTVLRRRGQLIAVESLPFLLGQKNGLAETDRRLVVLIDTMGPPLALAIDEILGKQEVVIKPLAGLVNNTGPFRGAAILGDGSVALILDPAALATGAGCTAPTQRQPVLAEA